jgi:ectoine hydroxylase-related dioxygenase (phytanoyl-CoA dioxygenase family)
MNAPKLQRLPPDCNALDIVEVCELDGGVIVDGWLDLGLLAQLNAELKPWLNGHQGTNSGSRASDSFLGAKTRRLQGLAVKAPSFIKILTDERLVTFAETVLKPVGPTVILNNGEVIDISPGESAQPFHRDDDAWNFANASSPLMINTIAALNDITAEMGSTLVVPGSHRWPSERNPNPEEIIASELPAGSALFFRGDVLHAGGANTTRKQRCALSTGICCGWLRPVENSYTNIPLDVVTSLPKRAKELLGYALYDASQVGGGFLGYHDLSDPMQIVDPAE